MELRILHVHKPNGLHDIHSHITHVFVTNESNQVWPALPAFVTDWMNTSFIVTEGWLKVETVIQQLHNNVKFYSVDSRGNKVYVRDYLFSTPKPRLAYHPLNKFISNERRYIRTEPNGSVSDNLLSLPVAPFLPKY
jgi:Protein of unknown function (DUF3892)